MQQFRLACKSRWNLGVRFSTSGLLIQSESFAIRSKSRLCTTEAQTGAQPEVQPEAQTGAQPEVQPEAQTEAQYDDTI